jgi:hypothetical protein
VGGLPRVVPGDGGFAGEASGHAASWRRGMTASEEGSDSPVPGHRLHPKLTHCTSWAAADGALPIVEGFGPPGSEHLPGGHPESRSGCGGRAPTQTQRTPTASGRRTGGASTSSTPSACSSRPRRNLPDDPHPRGGRPLDLAGPRRPHLTATGPAAGSRPAPPLREACSPDRLPPARVSAAASGTSARHPSARPVHRKLPAPAPAGLTRPQEHPVHRTTRRPLTTQDGRCHVPGQEPTTPRPRRAG